MKLTPHLISTAPSYLNPLHDRVIILRGLKAEVIENFGVTNDSYETIDLTDNEITTLGNFSTLVRLRTVLVSQNNIVKIDDNLPNNLPNLANLNLASNNLNDLTSVCSVLQNCKRLKTLILIDNPVAKNPNYRLYVIWKIPNLVLLDFAKVKLKERQLAEKLFGDKQMTEDIETKLVETTTKDQKKLGKMAEKLTEKEREALKEKLMNATNLDEIEMIENALSKGVV